MATKLTKLRIKELSGVDEPANELAGWIVQKSKDGRDAEIQNFEKDVVGLYESLAGESADLYLIDAPDEVLKARDDLIAHIGAGLEDDGEEVEKADEAEEGKTDTIVSKLRDVLKKGKVKPDPEDEEDAKDGGADEADEGEADGEEPEPEKKKMKKDATETENEEEAEVEKADGEEEVEKAEEGEEEAEVEKAETEEEDPALNAEDLAKAFTDELSLQLEPLREAVIGLADRVENVEKASAGRASLDGQDFLEDFEVDGEQESGMAKAIRGAVVHGKVQLT